MNFPHVQWILRRFPFVAVKFHAASKCDINGLKCEVCELAKARRRSKHSGKTTVNPERDGSLKSDHLRPGETVSVDHFESRLRGRTYDSYGKPNSETYVGGAIFVDHASAFLHVEHQLGFSAVETIRAKQAFERLALDHGVIVQQYLTDSGTFKANAFVQQIRNAQQRLRFCGTNAHHQNGVAERAVQQVSNMARAMLLHASSHWKDGIDSSLWPMAVKYATHVYNTTPKTNGIAPADIFLGSQVTRHRLQHLHVWGCPVYILDPTLQAGKKLPRWSPRSCRGIFVGYSQDHASEVPQVLNLQTGSITTQFHVVFDDLFSTVPSIGKDELPDGHWESLCLDHSIYIPQDSPPAYLHDDWLTPSEIDEKQRYETRVNSQRRTQTVRFTSNSPLPSRSDSEGATPLDSTSFDNDDSVPVTPPPSIDPPIPNSPSPPPTTSSQRTPAPLASPVQLVPPTSLRRSNRSNKGTFSQPKFRDEVYLSQFSSSNTDEQTLQLAYLADVATCSSSFEPNITDPRVYAAKFKKHDDDNPSWHQAMNGDHAEEYLSAMKQEVVSLITQRTWNYVERQTAPNILKSTWVFKLKRLPDGTPYKFKARFCCRGDLQQESVNYFDTYSPVVQWSTIRLLLTTVLDKSWTTRQVDYTNAFAQAELKETVHIEPPKLFAPRSGKDLVLHLLKSLYGLKQAPKTFFEKLREGLIERGYQPSSLDPCLFMKKGIICVVYVDDTIFAGADEKVLESEIQALGVSKDEQRHSFVLRNEGEVGNFLGIKIEKQAGSAFLLTQTGLIDKVIKATGMDDCNSVATPALPVPVHTDVNGTSIQESWEYPSVIGMLMYLSSNSRPDISYAVHQAARFSHNPKNSHAQAVKRIIRYLKGTRDKGLILCPTNDNSIKCYVDADFAGLYSSEDSESPLSVKSRTGYVIFYSGCPLLWVSRLQTQIALSTMESEYIALSQSMRDVIPLRSIVREILTIVFESPEKEFPVSTHSKAFQDVDSTLDVMPQSVVYEDNEACLKFARLLKMSPRTKHIGIPYHWFRSKVVSLDVAIEPISTHDQLGDQFTKGLTIDNFVKGRMSLMGW